MPEGRSTAAAFDGCPEGLPGGKPQRTFLFLASCLLRKRSDLYGDEQPGKSSHCSADRAGGAGALQRREQAAQEGAQRQRARSRGTATQGGLPGRLCLTVPKAGRKLVLSC